MNKESIQQAITQLRSAANILIVAGPGSNLDSVAAAAALSELLKRQDKQAKVIATGPISEKLNFLPEVSSVAQNAKLHKNTVIEVGLSKTELGELSYQKLPEALKIFLTPKSGEFEPGDIKIQTAAYPFDLVVVLGIPNLEQLSDFYAAHAQLFFEIPVLNIDYRASNENFGRINLVNLVASSVSEIVLDIAEAMDANLLDERIATLLLTGLVFATNSFQSQKTSPQVFVKASRLVSLGARQQEIVSHLYRFKSLGLLHLWGRVLARLKQDEQSGLVYSSLPASDIERSGATGPDQNEIITEMAQQLSFGRHFAFLVEAGSQTVVYISLAPPLAAANLFPGYDIQPVNQQTLKFTVSKPLAEAEKELTEAIKIELAKYAQ